MQHPKKYNDQIFTWRSALLGLVAYLVVILIVLLVV